MDYHLEVSTICNELKTSYKSKGHGGYNIYEDDKIYMAYDTYYPNCDVQVKDKEGNKHTVFSYSGHGRVCKYHSGAWENYLKEIYKRVPDAIEARKKKEEMQKEKEYQKSFGVADDKLNDIFYN